MKLDSRYRICAPASIMYSTRKKQRTTAIYIYIYTVASAHLKEIYQYFLL